MERRTRRRGSKTRQLIAAALDWAEVAVSSAFIVLFVFTFLFNRLRVDGRSMEDTLYDGDRILITDLMFYQPERGDVVICSSEALDKLIVKRIVALGGQTVTVDYIAGIVSVDGIPLEEPYLKYHALDDMGNYDMAYYDADREVYEYEVPEGYVFVMGDNRDHSNDSRAFGAVAEEDIVGKAVFRYYSQRARIGKIE